MKLEFKAGRGSDAAEISQILENWAEATSWIPQVHIIDISKSEATSLTKDAQKDTKNPVKGLGEHVPAFLLR